MENIDDLVSMLEDPTVSVGFFIKKDGEIALFYELEDGTRRFVQKKELLYRNSIGKSPVLYALYRHRMTTYALITHEETDLDRLFQNAEHCGFNTVEEYLNYAKDLIKQTKVK